MTAQQQTDADLIRELQELASHDLPGSYLCKLAGRAAARLAELTQELETERTDGMPTSRDERHLRRMLALRVGIPGLYGDDGEASGAQHGIQFDFMRDSVDDLQAKLTYLNTARWKAGEQAEQPASLALSPDLAPLWAGRVNRARCSFAPTGVDEAILAVDALLRKRLHTGVDPEMGFLLEGANAGEIVAHDYGVAQAMAAVTRVLDGDDSGQGSVNEPWASIRNRLLDLLRKRVQRLTDEQINVLWRTTLGEPHQHRKSAFDFARAIEAALGIGEEAK